MKKKAIKFLKSKGVRKVEKPGIGFVNLSHLRTPHLINLAARYEDWR